MKAEPEKKKLNNNPKEKQPKHKREKKNTDNTSVYNFLEDKIPWKNKTLKAAPTNIKKVAAVRIDRILSSFSEELLKDRKAILAKVSEHSRGLQDALPEFQNDRKVVLAALGAKIYNEESPLQYASEELQRDRELVLAADRRNGFSL